MYKIVRRIYQYKLNKFVINFLYINVYRRGHRGNLVPLEYYELYVDEKICEEKKKLRCKKRMKEW